ncbi:unnamed protein product [Cuscuta europaea]|uniref:Uncharacterized protein n=1 Tax=Cuscuta europaea TaxID=41803 RepID=A0A9P0ZMF7_CUSEU|nr:unnamed protein product [Cuscuta europaea]
MQMMRRKRPAAEVAGESRTDSCPTVFAGAPTTPPGAARFPSAPFGTGRWRSEPGSADPGSTVSAGSLGSSGSPNVFVFSSWTAAPTPGSRSFSAASVHLLRTRSWLICSAFGFLHRNRS